MQGKVSVRPESHSAFRSWAFLFLLVLSLARPVFCKTTSDFDPDANFSKFKTFTFIGGVENLVMLQLDPDVIYTSIHRNVVQELEKKGLHEVALGQSPDLVIRYWVSPASDVNVATMGKWDPYTPYITGNWAGIYNSTAISNNKISTLIIDLIDSKSKSLAWRLYLTRKLSDPEKDWKKADEEFVEGFKSYPPSDPEIAQKRKERQSQK